MSKCIYKYELASANCVIHRSFPKDFRPLCIGKQNDIIQLWAEVDIESPTQSRTVHIVGTGYDVPVNCDYLGTVHIGYFVWHVYLERVQ